MGTQVTMSKVARTLALILLVAFPVSVFVAWGVRHSLNYGDRLTESQQRALLWLADFPSTTIKIASAAYHQSRVPLVDWLVEKRSFKPTEFFEKWPAPNDDGYLLFSGFSDETDSAVVELIRISDGKLLMRWAPDWKEIAGRTTKKKFAWNDGSQESRAVHPVLLPDGDIVFNTGSALIRYDPCEQEADWLLDEVFHHSVELGPDGTLWAPIVINDPFPENSVLNRIVRDDGLAEVSLDGRILQKISFSRVLLENDLRVLVLGLNDANFSYDFLHLNQITPAFVDGKRWKKGDLLVSSRRLSSVFIYRPSTNSIVWHQMGPWLNQHSVAFYGDDSISVFDNNVVWGLPTAQPFFTPDDHNRVIVFNLESQTWRDPFVEILSKYRPRSATQGRSQVLSDGGLFIEETNNGRLMRFSETGLMWSKINTYHEKYVAKLAWSRYIEKPAAELAINSLLDRGCMGGFGSGVKK
jgi:hypothetical protein